MADNGGGGSSVAIVAIVVIFLIIVIAVSAVCFSRTHLQPWHKYQCQYNDSVKIGNSEVYGPAGLSRPKGEV